MRMFSLFQNRMEKDIIMSITIQKSNSSHRFLKTLLHIIICRQVQSTRLQIAGRPHLYRLKRSGSKTQIMRIVRSPKNSSGQWSVAFVIQYTTKDNPEEKDWENLPYYSNGKTGAYIVTVTGANNSKLGLKTVKESSDSIIQIQTHLASRFSTALLS